MRELSYSAGSLGGEGRNVLLMQKMPPCFSAQSIRIVDQEASFTDLSRPIPPQLC